ncbi:MAG: O-antigen ligase family protein [Candidatus Omnitrophica bacterium]|nr:O-antigen ligase family protein [Candidatus Omnitrophota bacterium]
MVDKKDFFRFIGTLVLAAIIGFAVIMVVDKAFAGSKNPVASIVIRAVLLIILTTLAMQRNRRLFMHCYLLAFPFLNTLLNGVSLVTLFGVILFLLYYKEIQQAFKNNIYLYKYPFILIVLGTVISIFLAKYPGAGFDYILLYISLLLVYWTLVVFIDKESNYRLVIKYIFAIYIFAGIISILQVTFGVNSIKIFLGNYNRNVSLDGSFNRIPGMFGDAQAAALYYASIFFVCLGTIICFYKQKKFLYFILLIGILGLAFSGSRLAILTFVFLFVIMHFVTLNFKKYVTMSLISLFLICFGASFYQGFLPVQITERFNIHKLNDSSDYRMKLWKYSLPIFYENPLGVGFGGENLYDAGLKVQAFFIPEFKENIASRKSTHFESSYLQILYSIGILGFLGFMLLIFQFFITGLKIYSNRRKNLIYKFSLYLMFSMTVWLFCVVTSPQIGRERLMTIFITLLALMNGLYNKLNNRSIDVDLIEEE